MSSQGPNFEKALETHQSVLGLCLIIEMILYYAVLYRWSNPRSQMGKPFEGAGIFCGFVARRCSAPQVAAYPETDCCLLADKLDVGCKSDVLDCICREALCPMGSMPAQILLYRHQSHSPRVAYIYLQLWRSPVHNVLQRSYGGSATDRNDNILSFLRKTVLEMVQSLKGIIFSKEGDNRETSARPEKPCLNCRLVFLFFVVRLGEFRMNHFTNECDTTPSYAVKLRHKPDPVYQ